MRRTSRGILAIDIALSLSHCIETRSTYALLLGRSNLQAAFIRQQVEELAKIAHHPAFLPTLVCSYHRTLLQKLSDSLNNDLFNVETDSGQTWTPIYNPRGFRRPGDCDDANITKRALGVIQLATAWEAYAKAVLCNIETIRDFMRYATSLVPEHRRSYVQLEDEIFHERLRFLEGKDKTVLWRFEYLKERAQAQQSAVRTSKSSVLSLALTDRFRYTTTSASKTTKRTARLPATRASSQKLVCARATR